MSVGEGHAHGRETVEVGREGLLVALGRVLVKVSDPVVQIINGDHQNVGLIGKVPQTTARRRNVTDMAVVVDELAPLAHDVPERED